MRLAWSLGLACALTAGAQTSVPGLEKDAARAHGLADAGVLPRATIDAAERGVADVQDDAILQRTLFGQVNVQDLTEEQGNEMLAAAQRRFDRRQAKLEKAKKLVEEGVLARMDLTPYIEELDRSRRTLDLAQVRANLLRELAEMARREEPALTSPENLMPEMRALVERFSGAGSFNITDLPRIESEFEKRFGKGMPISARGETALHRSLGFDHRGRVDVGVDPDNTEGRWLRGLLQNLKIPYFAFRVPVRGKSTGPHIHIGPPSESLRHGG